MVTSPCRSAHDGLAKRFDGCREVGDTEALVVTAIASLRDADGDPLYSRKEPAKVILACDKVLCGKNGDPDNHNHDKTRHWSKTEDPNGVPRIKVIYTLKNTGPLKKVAPPCPKKGVIGKGQEVASIMSKASGATAISTCPSSTRSTLA